MTRPARPARISPLLLLVAASVSHAPITAQVADSLRADSLQALDSVLAADSVLGADTMLAGDVLLDWPMAPADTSFTDSTYTGPLPPEAATRIGYLMSAYPETPGGMGLIETGMVEAEIAAQHVQLAGRDSTNLSNMVRHMAHVLHAIDPGEVGQGPGMGYGFRRAAEAVRMHAEEVMAIEDVPGVVDFHRPYVVQAARGALGQADDAVATARQVQRATSAEAAHRLVERLAGLVRAMAYGDDRDGDGRIGYTESESGLAQARYHLMLVERLTTRR